MPDKTYIIPPDKQSQLMKGCMAGERNFANSENEIITKLNGLKKINYNFLCTSELNTRFLKKWSAIATPYFKYDLPPINNGSVLKTYPYNIGLGTGVGTGFNNYRCRDSEFLTFQEAKNIFYDL